MKKSNKSSKQVNKGFFALVVKIYNSVFFYFPWLVREMLISSLRVARLVFTPKKIAPEIVRKKTKIGSDLGRVIYANSITLTPGTITIDLDKDCLIVHSLEKPEVGEDAMEKIIRGKLC